MITENGITIMDKKKVCLAWVCHVRQFIFYSISEQLIQLADGFTPNFKNLHKLTKALKLVRISEAYTLNQPSPMPLLPCLKLGGL